MADEFKKLIETVTTAAILATLSATVKAMLSKEENMWAKIRTFIAGVCTGLLVGFLLRDSNHITREVAVMVSSAFISTAWPLLENLVKKYIAKKGEKLTNGNNDANV